MKVVDRASAFAEVVALPNGRFDITIGGMNCMWDVKTKSEIRRYCSCG
jgi:thiamine biosynthesis lipoprotein ApbE